MAAKSSCRVYATAFRSVAVPCDSELLWESMSPPASIASWGCSIVDRCDVEDPDPRVRCITLRPAEPGAVVLIRERLIKAERTPAGEKSSVCYENIDTGSASPFPVFVMEMQTSLTVTKITTLSSPLGRSLVELRSTFVVETNEDAIAMRDFIEKSLFDPLLMCLCEMLIPAAPFRDSMFAAVMAEFEKTVTALATAAARLRTEEAHRLTSSDPSASSGRQRSPPGSLSCGDDPINIPVFASAAVSSCQEIYSAWLETARELRRLEKKLEVDEHEQERRRYGGGAATEQSKTKDILADAKKRFSYEAAYTDPVRRRMQDQIGINANGVYGHRFELSTPGTYIASSPVAARVQATVEYAVPLPQLSAAGRSPAQDLQRRRLEPHHRQPPPPPGWTQEIFDDAADEIVAEDSGKICDGRGELLQHAPPPPPRRVLGNR